MNRILTQFKYVVALIAVLLTGGLANAQTPGTLDPTFNFGNGEDWAANLFNGFGQHGSGNSIAQQSDGKYIVGGQYVYVQGLRRNALARINANGSVDPTFDIGTGPNGSNIIIKDVIVQDDQKVYACGSFSSWNSVTRNRVVRLNTNGSVDASFNTSGFTTGDSRIETMALQSDGKLLVGGWWTQVGSTTTTTLCRLNTDGTLDATFNSNMVSTFGTTMNSATFDIAILPDGKILCVGQYGVFRINSNGTKDNTFTLAGTPSGWVLSVFVQADGKYVIGGRFTAIGSNSRNRLARINADGSFDATFVQGGSGGTDQYWMIPASGGGMYLWNGTNIVKLNSNGETDNTFTAVPVYRFGGASVNKGILNSNGNLLVVGNFDAMGEHSGMDMAEINTSGVVQTTFNKQNSGSGEARKVVRGANNKIYVGHFGLTFNGLRKGGVLRLNSDGSLDQTWNASGIGASDFVSDIKEMADGKVFISGNFTQYNGTAAVRLIKLNADGTRDNSFATVGTGLNGTVNAFAVQPDGKVVAVGVFTSLNGTACPNIIRFNANGTRDTDFNTGTGFNNQPTRVAVLSDGKILVSGFFTQYNGSTSNHITRLNSNGSIDGTFSAGTAGQWIRDFAVQSDEKVVIVGDFSSFAGASNTNRIARLNTNGSVDNTFSSGTGFNDHAQAVTIASDGKIYTAGRFTTYRGVNRAGVARLNSDGSPDATFSTGANGLFGNHDGATTANAASIMEQADGQVLVAGDFFTIFGQGRPFLTRIQGAACVTPSKPTITGATSFCSGGSVTLTASGASGHVWSNGATTKNITVNAAGTYSVTRINGACTSEVSDDFVVSVNPTPTQPTVSGNRSFCAGTSTVLTSSSATGNIWSNGATTQSITVTAAGTYSVSAISNGCTSVVSEPIVVTVTALPTTPEVESNIGTSICLGSTAILSAGTADGYIWSTGATTPTIAVSNPGSYSVSVIVNGCTSAVSSAIVITNQICSQVFTGTGNLSNAAMWSSGNAPVAGTDIVVRGQLTAASSISLRNVSLDAGHSIILPAGVTLTITGNLSNEGTISGDGTLRIAGSNNQAFGGGTISNLLVDNGATAVLSSATSISNTLTIGNNTTFNMNNAGLTMLSTAMRTARLAAVPATASITNSANFTVQRYLNPSNVRGAVNGRGNYYLTGPVVQGKTVGLWNSVSPYGPETFNQTTQNGSRFYFFNNPTGSWRKPTSMSQSLPAGTGVQVWFGSSAFFSGGRTTWSVSGMPVVGNFNLPLGTGSGFHLVSNPYPSTIDWDSDQWTKTNLAGAIYIYDWVNLRYRTYSGGIGTNGGSRYLTTAQGFFVNATAANPALTAREGIKVTNQIAMQRSATVLGLLRFEITDASGLDEMVIANRAAAVAGFDADDAEKFMNPMTNIYAVGTPNQAIASMNLDNVSAIPFVILNRNSGTVTLRTSQFNNLEGYTFNLFDEQTGELLPYSPDAVYTFTVGANQAYRLQLRVGSVTGIENFKANVFEVFPNPTTGHVTLTTTTDAENVSVVNAVGQVVFTAKAQAQMEMNLNHLAKGVYMVQVQSAKGVSSQRLVIK